jgi:hypothetical protein
MFKVHLNRLASLLALSCMFVLYSQSGWAGTVNTNLTFGASTSSTLTITGVSNYCGVTTGFCSGLGLQGFATGTDSLGGSYTLGSFGSFFGTAGSPDSWYQASGCAGFNTNCRWASDLSFTDSSSYGLNGSDDPVTLFQAPGGSITMTLLACVAAANNVCTASTNLIFDLQVDPAMLANLQAGQSVDLTVIGGCITTGTSCGSGTSGGVTPEPGTLLLLSSGLLGFAPFIRRKFARC